MLVGRADVRGFRNLARVRLDLAEGVTVLHGPNGAGKTNLLEAVYFGLTGRSCRTRNEREMVGFDQEAARVELTVAGESSAHVLTAAVAPGEAKRMEIDGAAVESRQDPIARPLVGVFLPERLDLVKGAPGMRRSHLDQVVTALWPARADRRRNFASALAQRNALLSRARSGAGSVAALAAWDAQYAAAALELVAVRREATEALAGPFAEAAMQLGLPGAATVAYRPRVAEPDAQALEAALRERADDDLARGYSGYGPHRDELELSLDGRSLRRYGSQGQQRAALLALLLAERDVLAAAGTTPPLMLLDDVLSELDAERRRLLVERLRPREGSPPSQAVLTTTELEHIPPGLPFERVAVAGGVVAQVKEAA